MDSKTLRLAIVSIISVMALAIGMVFYANRKDNSSNSGKKVVSDNEKQVGVSDADDIIPDDSYHAFLRDDSFFDDDSNGVIVKDKPGLPNLSMIATSIQHDIRVVVIDDDGNVVSGENLYILIDEEEYKDLDKDGIITIPDLSAGDYYVSLDRVDGYNVPQEPMRVTVKDNLEFAVIDDISYYIYTEDQINAQLEDTSHNAGIDSEDVDTSETSEIKNNGDASFGIDVSKWQKRIDWDRVKRSGVEFAIIRCGYRGSSTGVLVEDPMFRENIEGAKAAGIKVGVYFYTQATNDVEAVEEASMVASLLKEYELDYPAFIDTESTGGNGRADGLPKDLRTKVCVAFCETIKSCGYDAGVYASRSWFYNNLNADELSEYVIWDAEYRNSPIYTGDYKLWQYTSNGMIDGITTRVDLNISYY